MATFGERLKRIRLARGETQQQVANGVGLSIGMISVYEQREKLPNLQIFLRFSDYFGCTLDYLSGRSEQFGGLFSK